LRSWTLISFFSSFFLVLSCMLPFICFVVCAFVDSLASSGCAGVQLARQPPIGWTRWVPAFRIFRRLEIPDFDFVFLFLFVWSVLHVTFHLLVVCAFVGERPRRRTPCNILLVIADRLQRGSV
jgi:hypothetical protein